MGERKGGNHQRKGRPPRTENYLNQRARFPQRAKGGYRGRERCGCEGVGGIEGEWGGG